MEVILYKNNDYKNKIVKTLGSTEKYCTLSKVILHDETSLLNPSLLVDLNDLIHVLAESKRVGYVYEDGSSEKYSHVVYTKAISDLCSCNYVYIKEFNRYYFIEDISIYRTNLWRIKCHVDVLTSYQNELKHQHLYISRISGVSNSYLYADDLAIFSPIKKIKEIEVSDGALVNTQLDVSSVNSARHYCITVYNDEETDTAFTWQKEKFNILPEVAGQYLFSAGLHTYALNSYTSLLVLNNLLLSSFYSKYQSYVKSIIRFPFSVDGLSKQEGIRIYDKDLPIDTVYYIQPKNYIVADFTYTNDEITKDLYKDSSIELYIPYIGWKNFNIQDILNNRIVVTYDVNYTTGESIVTVLDYNNSRLLFTSQCQIGQQINLLENNINEINANNISQGASLAISAISTGIGIATANPVAAVGGVMSLGKSVASFATNQMTNYEKVDGKITSSNGGSYLPQKVRIKATYPNRINRTEQFGNIFGFPYQSVLSLSYIKDSAFFICSDVQLSDMNTATKTEQDEIKSLLESGVYK